MKGLVGDLGAKMEVFRYKYAQNHTDVANDAVVQVLLVVRFLVPDIREWV